MRDTADRLQTSGRRYEERGEQARGGMGRILRVWDRHMRREVALKEVLPARGSRGGQVVARFLREARITGRLQHPSIVPVHEIGIRENGTLYYTMKLVRGQTLRQAIKVATSIEERLKLLPHYLNLCQAMAYAHAHGVIHRDLKPSNVMIGEFGETQVIDWGLAKDLLAEREADSSAEPDQEEPGTGEVSELTQAGQLLGTPHYMAPEQAMGRHEALDARTDVYALGAVLYELLTGSRPYQASTRLEVLRKCAEGAPVPPEVLCPEAPAPLVAICRRAMARNPDARYLSAGELATEIASFQAGARVSAYDYGVGELLARFLRRHRPVVVTVALALALLSGLGAYSYLNLRERHAAELDLRLKSERKGYDLSILLAQSALEEYRYKEAAAILAACPPEYRDWEWGYFSKAMEDTQVVGMVDQSEISDALIMPDGKHLLTLDWGGAVNLWTYPGLALAHRYDPIEGGSWAGAIHPEGKEFTVYREKGGLLRWNLENHEPLAVYEFSALPAGNALAYSPDGRFIVAGESGGLIRQWALAQDAVVRTFQSEAPIVQDLAFSPDGRWLASAGDTGRVQIWDWSTGLAVATFNAHMENIQLGTQGVLAVRFSPNGAILATSGCDGKARLWDTSNWALRHTLAGFPKKIRSVEFSVDGSTLATCSERTVRLWDTRTGAEKPSWIKCDQGVRRVIFHPDGEHLVTAETVSRITRWALRPASPGTFLSGHTADVNAVRFSPDGRYLASSSGHWKTGGDNRVLIWDLATVFHVPAGATSRAFDGDGNWVNHLDFHPDGLRLAGADGSGKVITWNWHTGDRVGELGIPSYVHGARCVAYHPDGDILATAGWGDGPTELNTVELWDANSNRSLRQLSGPTRCVDSIAFSPDGSKLAGGSRDGTIHLWDPHNGAILWSRQAGEGWIYGVAFSGDGRLVGGSSDTSTVIVWDSLTGTEIHRLEGLQMRANKVAFNPEGTRVAACDDSMIKVWNVETGAALITLQHGAQDLAFSPDGRTLATAGFDGRVGVWPAAAWDTVPRRQAGY
jgi:WD40 repeat protein